ncbi:MAG: hypothetical protein U1F11_11470 [Steroidobacteraceae bacterium]
MGVSSGSVIASCLANGIDTEDLARLFITSESARYLVSPAMLFGPPSTSTWNASRSCPACWSRDCGSTRAGRSRAS